MSIRDNVSLGSLVVSILCLLILLSGLAAAGASRLAVMEARAESLEASYRETSRRLERIEDRLNARQALQRTVTHMQDNRKHYWESRTFWFGFLTIVLGGLQAANGVVADPRALGVIGIAIGALTVVLRALTEGGLKP